MEIRSNGDKTEVRDLPVEAIPRVEIAFLLALDPRAAGRPVDNPRILRNALVEPLVDRRAAVGEVSLQQGSGWAVPGIGDPVSLHHVASYPASSMKVPLMILASEEQEITVWLQGIGRPLLAHRDVLILIFVIIVFLQFA